MIDLKILNLNRQQLTDFIRFEAGSSSPEYFLCKAGGGLELQQVPEEYAQLLLWFKANQFKTYLELGIGRGGSFLLNVLFQSQLTRALAVDNCLYWQQSQKDDIQAKVNFLKTQKKANVEFINSSTDEFFRSNHESFDCIFIDADHSYAGARRDYDNALRFLNPGGYIIFHDINSRACPGVCQLWNEVRNEGAIEFAASQTCGIGIIKVSGHVPTVARAPRSCYCGSPLSFESCHGDLGWNRQLNYLSQAIVQGESFLGNALNSALKGNLVLADLLVKSQLTQDGTDLNALLLQGEICLKIEMLDSAAGSFKQALAIAKGSGATSSTIAMIEATIDLIDRFRHRAVPDTRRKKYLLIKAWGYGFWSDVDHVIGQLLVSELTGRTPVIHWGENSLFGDKGGDDAFTNYFEPVSDALIDDLASEEFSYYPPKWTARNIKSENNDKWTGRYCRQTGTLFLGRSEDVVVSDFHTPIAHLIPWIPENSPYRKMRWHEIYQHLFKRYLRLKPRIAKLIEDFYLANMAGRSWIAVHVRGSDKLKEQRDLLEVNKAYFDFIDAALAQNAGAGLFLLTDSSTYLDTYKTKYGERVLTTTAIRTDGDQGVHLLGHSGREVGDSVVLDCYLAAKCDRFFGNGGSNVSAAIGSLKEWADGSYQLLGRDLRSNISITVHNW